MNQNIYTSPELLSKEEIEELLPELADLEDWISRVKAYALSEAIKGEHYKGFKVVEGRSVAQYTDEHELIRRAEELGYNKAIFYKSPTLIGVSDFKRIVKKDYDKFTDLISRPQGKLTLVSEDDKRPAYVANDVANDFADELSQANAKAGQTTKSSKTDFDGLF